MTAKIVDFGKKIGGARKDLYAISNLDGLTDVELADVRRDKIWKKPNIQKELNNGVDIDLLYWREMIRKAIPTKPDSSLSRTVTNDRAKAYIRIVTDFMDFANNATEVDAIGLDRKIRGYFPFINRWHYDCPTEEAKSIRNHKLFGVPKDLNILRKLRQKEMFGMTSDEKANKQATDSLKVFKYVGIVDTRPKEVDIACFVASEQEDDYKVLACNVGYGWRYGYIRDSEFDISQWDVGTNVIIDKHGHVLLGNIKDSEIESTKNRLIGMAEEQIKDKRKPIERKKSFMPPQLMHVVQDGGYAIDVHANSDDYMEILGFRAGEFGNWESDMDRQVSMDMGYIAFKNLAAVLGINDKDVSLMDDEEKSLAIAFGARGHSKALAHYEPGRRVINLTKMKGAGALAHEWGHALDHYIGIKSGCIGLATENIRKNTPEIIKRIVKAMRYKQVDKVVGKDEFERNVEKETNKLKHMMISWQPYKGNTDEYDKFMNDIIDRRITDYSAVRSMIDELSELRKKACGRCIPKEQRDLIVCIYYYHYMVAVKKLQEISGDSVVTKYETLTDFYKGSRYFAENFSKCGASGWASECEMFARAFDCYINDKLKQNGIRDDYLSAHCDGYATKDLDGNIVRAYPYGDERIVLNSLFDELIDWVKLNYFFDSQTVS